MECVETDEALVRKAQAGDARAFDRLVERHYPNCLRFATRMLGDLADAEEAVQDAFVRAHTALARYEDRQRFAAWVLHILANRCRTTGLRRAWRRARILLYGQQRFESASVEAPAADWRDELQRALLRLPRKQREAFLLKHLEELSYQEMVDVTGDSESALKMRVKRACAALESMIKDAR